MMKNYTKEELTALIRTFPKSSLPNLKAYLEESVQSLEEEKRERQLEQFCQFRAEARERKWTRCQYPVIESEKLFLDMLEKVDQGGSSKVRSREGFQVLMTCEKMTSEAIKEETEKTRKVVEAIQGQAKRFENWLMEAGVPIEPEATFHKGPIPMDLQEGEVVEEPVHVTRKRGSHIEKDWAAEWNEEPPAKGAKWTENQESAEVETIQEAEEEEEEEVEKKSEDFVLPLGF